MLQTKRNQAFNEIICNHNSLILRPIKMNSQTMKKAILIPILLFGLFVVSLAQQAKQLQFREETYDFGTVVEDKGPVTHEFVFTNNSNRPVKILTVQASCGCTTPGWSKEAVAPGKTGFVQASFNPKGRPGFFTKSLTVTTDFDPNPIMLQIKGQVTSENTEPNASEFSIVNGGLKLKVSSFNMGKIYIKDEYVVREFPVLNGSEKAITIDSKVIGPKHIKVDVQPLTIAPGAKGVIKISYNGKLKNEYGFQSDNIELHTDDTTNPVKSFSVFATLEDFFPVLSDAEAAKAPQLRLNAHNVDFGRVKPGEPAVREIQFTNSGKKELNLKSLQGNCTCISASANKTTVKPGETSVIKISFDSQGRKGTQNKAVTIYSNDPKNPVQRLTATAYIED
jgi:hypothetical protein